MADRRVGLQFRSGDIDNMLGQLNRALAIVELVRHHDEACRYVDAVGAQERAGKANVVGTIPGEVADGVLSAALYSAYDDIKSARNILNEANTAATMAAFPRIGAASV